MSKKLTAYRLVIRASIFHRRDTWQVYLFSKVKTPKGKIVSIRILKRWWPDAPKVRRESGKKVYLTYLQGTSWTDVFSSHRRATDYVARIHRKIEQILKTWPPKPTKSKGKKKTP